MQAIFLDRDGVINRERADYVKNWQEFELLPDALAALIHLATLPHRIIIITNQSAIGRGVVDRATVDDIHHRLKSIVETDGGRIDAFYVCPHHPKDDCACRKPKPGLLLQAAHEFDLDLTQCTFVGDSLTDYQAAAAAGCRSILVTTGRQGSSLGLTFTVSSEPPVVANLHEASSMIMDQALQFSK